MGIQVEFNPDLCLREGETGRAERRSSDECLPEKIKAGCDYPFLKRGQRLYWLQGEIPLRATTGDGNLSRPLASVVIQRVIHEIRGGEVFTLGSFRVIEVFTDGAIHFEGYERVDR